MKMIRSLFFVIVMIIFVTPYADANAGRDAAVSTFFQGETKYQEGQYADAVAIYKKILDSGWESGPVYYNLGNSYFKMKDIGHAVLNYERALRLMPRDSDVAFNYKYARSFIKAGTGREDLNVLDKLILSHVNFYSLDEMFWMVMGLSLLTAILFVLMKFVRFSQRKRNLVMCLLFSLILIYTVGLIYKISRESGKAISLKETSARFEPNEHATAHFALSPGAKVKIVKKEREWCKVRRFDGKLGWVEADTLEYIAYAQPKGN